MQGVLREDGLPIASQLSPPQRHHRRHLLPLVLPDHHPSRRSSRRPRRAVATPTPSRCWRSVAGHLHHSTVSLFHSPVSPSASRCLLISCLAGREREWCRRRWRGRGKKQARYRMEEDGKGHFGFSHVRFSPNKLKNATILKSGQF